jgi:predicted ATP-dependent endonuclease of OLD family
MKIISRLEVSRFRSLRDCRIDKLGHLTAFAGLNNSGKSNVLRALNAFFLGEVEPGVPLSFERDFYRPELSSKKKKRIRIGVGFVLPKHFRFRKDLAPVQQLVGQNVEIVKEWDPSDGEPTIYLNGSKASADSKEAELVRQFLSMISFRYIPNRVLPLDVIRQEHAALRDALVRRLARKARTHEAVFKEIEATSTSLIKKMGSTSSSSRQDSKGSV